MKKDNKDYNDNQKDNDLKVYNDIIPNKPVKFQSYKDWNYENEKQNTALKSDDESSDKDINNITKEKA
jgi:hypothetical protein